VFFLNRLQKVLLSSERIQHLFCVCDPYSMPFGFATTQCHRRSPHCLQPRSSSPATPSSLLPVRIAATTVVCFLIGLHLPCRLTSLEGRNQRLHSTINLGQTTNPTSCTLMLITTQAASGPSLFGRCTAVVAMRTGREGGGGERRPGLRVVAGATMTLSCSAYELAHMSSYVRGR
jgi:hypothetical protein